MNRHRPVFGRLVSAVLIAAVLAIGAGCGADDQEPSSTIAPAGADTSTTSSVPPTTSPPPSITRQPAPHVFPLAPPGACDYADGHHDYPASDIFCPVGTEVVAVTDGVVDFVSRVDRWAPAVDDPALRGGLSVAIVGDDGVRYYGSHLFAVDPAIRVGDRVVAGEHLGLSGASGNAAGTDPHLHFGISRPTTPGDWMVRRGEVNPYPYLQAWARGENVTPVL